MCKKKIKYDLSIQIGFFVLTDAKLRVFEFYYHCIEAYLHRRDFQSLAGNGYRFRLYVFGWRLVGRASHGQARKERRLYRHQAPVVSPSRTSLRKPPMINANLGSSKWNGVEMVLWASIVKPTAVRRASKPANKMKAPRIQIKRKRILRRVYVTSVDTKFQKTR